MLHSRTSPDLDRRERGSLSWKAALEGRIHPVLEHEIDVFEELLARARRNKADIPVFAESRLRRGVYGQRYDNGSRNDGTVDREIRFPSGDLLKGPETKWDAPGMQRIKVPFGGVTSAQMKVLADLAEEYADGIIHVTTRQDFQLHYVHIDDTPDLMRRLGASGITTAEACGNVVRNVTCCPLSGVCRSEQFDVTPHALSLAQFLLGHPDTQQFGRKFKISFSGCADQPCGLARMHDIGVIARTRTAGGATERGFELWVGGGLGAVPHQASLFAGFVPEEELLPTCQAIARVFARLGEKKNRARARLKFLVAKLGIEEFRRLVLEEREKLPDDPRWRELPAHRDGPGSGNPGGPKGGEPDDNEDAEYERWQVRNTRPQRQQGYVAVTVTLPLGDLTSAQLRNLADITARFAGDAARTTVDQNIMLRWVSRAGLPELFRELKEARLAEPDADSIADITACPGTDTCKLGIASSRGLARELRGRLAARLLTGDGAVGDLRIKVSGCFNSCGQHHIADIGFWGVSRKAGRFVVPHFQVVLGGGPRRNAESYGMAIGAIPSKSVPDALDRILDLYEQNKEPGEEFQRFVARTGRPAFRSCLADLLEIPDRETSPAHYSDWGDPREFTIGDMGTGECAGNVVDPVSFELQAAERELFSAQERFEAGDYRSAGLLSYRAVLVAAGALVKHVVPDAETGPDGVVASFREHLHDTGLFNDPYAGSKFANYFFEICANHDKEEASPDRIRRQLEQGQLFIEACHASLMRLAPVEAS